MPKPVPVCGHSSISRVEFGHAAGQNTGLQRALSIDCPDKLWAITLGYETKGVRWEKMIDMHQFFVKVLIVQKCPFNVFFDVVQLSKVDNWAEWK